jgi:hypothetical protein
MSRKDGGALDDGTGGVGDAAGDGSMVQGFLGG